MGDPAPPADVAARAAAAARQHALRAAVRIDELREHRDLVAASRLLDAVWGRDEQAGAIVAPELLQALVHAGNQVTGAWRGHDLVAATVAVLGRDHAAGRIHLHSHITGVVADAQGHGVGRALKWYQRAWVLERGIDEVRWTFDPLVRRNAVFNLGVLGARIAGYVEDLYGAMPDARNAGLPTDRVWVRWRVTEHRVERAAAGATVQPDAAALRGAGARDVVVATDDDAVVHEAAAASTVLVQVPPDIEAIRAADPVRGRRWTSTVRAQLGARLAAGWGVAGITRDGRYVVTRQRGVEELV